MAHFDSNYGSLNFSLSRLRLKGSEEDSMRYDW